MVFLVMILVRDWVDGAWYVFALWCESALSLCIGLLSPTTYYVTYLVWYRSCTRRLKQKQASTDPRTRGHRDRIPKRNRSDRHRSENQPSMRVVVQTEIKYVC